MANLQPQAEAQCHSFFHFEQAALFVGQDSTSPAADVHVGLFVRGYGWFRCAKSGSWRTRADLEVCPTKWPISSHRLKPVLPLERQAQSSLHLVHQRPVSRPLE